MIYKRRNSTKEHSSYL